MQQMTQAQVVRVSWLSSCGVACRAVGVRIARKTAFSVTTGALQSSHALSSYLAFMKLQSFRVMLQGDAQTPLLPQHSTLCSVVQHLSLAKASVLNGN